MTFHVKIRLLDHQQRELRHIYIYSNFIVIKLCRSKLLSYPTTTPTYVELKALGVRHMKDHIHELNVNEKPWDGMVRSVEGFGKLQIYSYKLNGSEVHLLCTYIRLYGQVVTHLDKLHEG